MKFIYLIIELNRYAVQAHVLFVQMTRVIRFKKYIIQNKIYNLN